MKLHFICENDKTLNYIEFNRDFTVATNAHVMIVVPTDMLIHIPENLPETPTVISTEEYKQLFKGKNDVRVVGDKLTVVGKDITATLAANERPLQWRNVLKTARESAFSESKVNRINLELFGRLAKVMPKNTPMDIKHLDNYQTMVTFPNYDGVVCLIMGMARI